MHKHMDFIFHFQINFTEMCIFITIHDFWFIFTVSDVLIQKPAKYFINKVVNNATLNNLQLDYFCCSIVKSPMFSFYSLKLACHYHVQNVLL